MATNEPSILKFAFTDFKIINERKWSAKCKHCREIISETRGTSSGFKKHLDIKHETGKQLQNIKRYFNFIFKTWLVVGTGPYCHGRQSIRSQGTQ